ncbi:hypothetical protein EN925_08365 [Mesorhizobium sp. M7A.F.Ca.US.006.04.2.1]|nr:hypothetical protein EN990_11730 [Mesorhizobium sp. M7A.F.Ca.US.005.03.1.1]RUY17752.1 hypothetical protein EN991_06645 [Mesorhizobium sp. M7A.F.Ca.US.005.03.2.1]RUY27161.1 hypothetical protein EN979_17505 [Mesorhizobium sp. M7A.F.Ca.US.001.04.2.1]RUY41726.1 hypothetical protein EN978_14500 [Mesorhizobium sp. M7A.F.Ca.US.001.04.1.1]RVA93448.1 hypothetical protein EN925_08365 [Mesorhizobium sp. M7A.F.Ca.US.006.04.2.1]
MRLSASLAIRRWAGCGEFVEAPAHVCPAEGFPGLALVVQETLKRDPHGHLFVFYGRCGVLIKVLWHDRHRSRSLPNGELVQRADRLAIFTRSISPSGSYAGYAMPE